MGDANQHGIMQLKRFIEDDDAVSPVIGVILMVAITVILAAVIATFVLGLGEQISATGPTASFDFEYDDGLSPPELTVTHTSGNTIEAGNLYLRGSNEEGSWDTLPGSSYGASSKINAGSSVTVEVDASDTVRVVWESDEGSQTSTLEKWSGPSA